MALYLYYNTIDINFYLTLIPYEVSIITNLFRQIKAEEDERKDAKETNKLFSAPTDDSGDIFTGINNSGIEKVDTF